MLIYAVCCTSRSGSTYLCQLLSSTGLLGLPDEYMNRDDGSGEPYWRRKMNLEDASPQEYVQQLIQQRPTDGVFGIKCVPVFLKRFQEHTRVDRYVWLRRRNVLRQAISLYRSNVTGSWSRYSTSQKIAAPEFNELEIKKRETSIHRVNANWAAFFQSEKILPLEVFYEDVCSAPLQQIRRIAEFLEVDPTRISHVEAATLKMADETNQRWYRKMNADRKPPESAEIHTAS